MALSGSYLAHVRLVSFVALLLSATIAHSARLSAATFDCDYGVMAAVYNGSEVECSEGYRQNICDAACAYCFNTSCIAPVHCEAGVSAQSWCSNTP